MEVILRKEMVRRKMEVHEWINDSNVDIMCCSGCIIIKWNVRSQSASDAQQMLLIEVI